MLAIASLGSLGATAGAGALLLLGMRRLGVIVPLLVSFASGTLLAGATLGLLPKALDQTDALTVMTWLLAGLIGFFVLERLVIWRHCHIPQCDIHRASGYLILVGDAFHNFMDGIAIGASFAVSVPLGVTTGLAVVAHEIPQELGDFGILLDSQFSTKQALGLNLASASFTIPGALVSFLAFSDIQAVLPVALALAASSFLYIALADLVPRLHQEAALSSLPAQVGLITLGVATIVVVRVLTA